MLIIVIAKPKGSLQQLSLAVLLDPRLCDSPNALYVEFKQLTSANQPGIGDMNGKSAFNVDDIVYRHGDV